METQARVHHHSSLGRARQIAAVLARHELWHLVDALDLGRLVPFHRGSEQARESATRQTGPERLRCALEELGPTFVKLGQMLSARDDLLPPEYRRELAKLQDAAPLLPLDVVRETITSELGRPPEEAFATFEETPLAAASIGQTHRAILHDGSAVVVKVRRPGAVEQVDEDLKLLHSLAAIAGRRWEAARQYDLPGLVQQFDASLRAELDYLREGRHAERFAHNFTGDGTVHIPRVFWEQTTTRVLTQERLEGVKVTNLEALAAAGVDRAALAARAARIVLKMVFEDGFFHADLHPGNLFVEEGGCIGLIDFGMVGVVDDATRQALARLMLAVRAGDAAVMVDAVLDLSTAPEPVDRAALGRELGPLLARCCEGPLTGIAIGPLLSEVLAIVRRHHLVLPANLALLLKTVAMCEGMGEHLDPSFCLMDVLVPYGRRLMVQQMSPQALLERLEQEGPDLAWLATALPRHLRRLLTDLERGSLKVGIQPMGMEPLLRRVERVAHRLVLAIIVAALIIGLAILMAASHPVRAAQALDTFVTVGAIVVAVLALALAWSVARSSRHR